MWMLNDAGDVAVGWLGVEMSAVLENESQAREKVRYTQEDLKHVELKREEVSAAMRQASFSSADVENWFEGVRFHAQQALSDM
jgi:hypothetical protein